MSITVKLSPPLEAMVREKVASGEYASEADVVEQALLLLQRHEAVQAAELDALCRDIAQGLADLDAGRVVDAEAVFKELEQIVAEGQGR